MKKIFIPALALGMLPLTAVRADDTPLAEQMEEMNGIYKSLRRGTLEDGPAEARKAQEAVLKALTMTPEFVESGGHKGPKDVAMAEYRRQVGLLFVAWCEIELALIAKDQAKIDELIAKLKDLKSTGHDEFMEE